MLFFPDPWHKARHHKRRIVQASFAELVRSKLKVGGILHMATDWEPYAEYMLSQFNNYSLAPVLVVVLVLSGVVADRR